MNAATVITLLAVAATIGAALTGLLFRAAAAAWKEERDAERERGNRLEGDIAEHKAEIERLRERVAELERRTNVEELARQISEEHREVVSVLKDMQRELAALPHRINEGG